MGPYPTMNSFWNRSEGSSGRRGVLLTVPGKITAPCETFLTSAARKSLGGRFGLGPHGTKVLVGAGDLVVVACEVVLRIHLRIVLGLAHDTVRQPIGLLHGLLVVSHGRPLTQAVGQATVHLHGLLDLTSELGVSSSSMPRVQQSSNLHSRLCRVGRRWSQRPLVYSFALRSGKRGEVEPEIRSLHCRESVVAWTRKHGDRWAYRYSRTPRPTKGQCQVERGQGALPLSTLAG